MNGDFTRFPIGRVADSLYPLQQQGRVHLDSDWNELATSLTDSVRLSFDALLGGSAAIDVGFGPQGQANAELAFAPGTYFVDGYRVVAPAMVRVDEQPWPLPGDHPFPPLTGDGASILFYLDVWIRHVTARSLPNLAEVALRGPDTTTRGILTWQVRSTRTREQTAAEIRQGWSSVSNRIWRRERGMLRSWVELAETQEPCLDDVAGGYSGPRNQLYRFEVAPAEPVDGGAADARVILWSRDNASVESRIRTSAGDTVELVSDPTSEALQAGGLVQPVDDDSDLGGPSHSALRVQAVDLDEDRVTLTSAPMGHLGAAEAASSHARLRHWDGILPLEDGPKEIEHGLRIELKDVARAEVGDYWLVAARTTGELLWPDERRWPRRWPVDWPDEFRPPHGTEHMLAPLALVVGASVFDCRWTVASLRSQGRLTLTPLMDALGPNGWQNVATGAKKDAQGLDVDASGTMAISIPNGVTIQQLRATGVRPSGDLNVRLRRAKVTGGGIENVANLPISQSGEFDEAVAPIAGKALTDTAKFSYFIQADLGSATAGDTIRLESFEVTYDRG